MAFAQTSCVCSTRDIIKVVMYFRPGLTAAFIDPVDSRTRTSRRSLWWKSRSCHCHEHRVQTGQFARLQHANAYAIIALRSMHCCALQNEESELDQVERMMAEPKGGSKAGAEKSKARPGLIAKVRQALLSAQQTRGLLLPVHARRLQGRYSR